MNYNVCRWCQSFKEGCCINEAFAIDLSLDISPFIEDGKLSESIQEGFGSIKFSEVEKLLASTKTSKKLQAQVMKALHEEFESVKVSLVESIDKSVSTALQNFEFPETKGIWINEPSNFRCEHFR